MKKFFRYFRGEFNGHYLRSLAICPNYTISDISDELAYQVLCQWKLEDEVDSDEMSIRDEDVLNIARIAGLYQLQADRFSMFGSIWFTQSHLVNGEERSERGLLDMNTGLFRFVREDNDDYPDDIINESSENLRASLVPEGAVPVGYLPYDRQLYTWEGDVIYDNLLPEPPTDGTPYTAFYGENFLTLEERHGRETMFTINVFKRFFECMQCIRHNGPSIGSFMEITRLLGEGYIHDIEITPSGKFYTVAYKLGKDSNIPNKDRRLAAWRDVISKKFKLFALLEEVA